MRKPTSPVVVAILFALACFAIQANGPYAAEEATTPGVQKWEYHIYQVNPPEISTAQYGKSGLNAKGKEGWEFCQAVSVETFPTSIILKRPLR